MRTERWSAAVIDHLVRSKRGGADYEAAWRAALRAYPPLGGSVEVTLFDERGEPHDSMVAFLRRVAESAYNDAAGPAGSGNGPAIRSFQPDMLRDLEGESAERGLAA